MKRSAQQKILALAFFAMLPMTAQAQELSPLSPYPPATSEAPQQPAYTQQQIDQMTAPVALYPDQLVAQILMAATYPLEIVEATRWQQNSQNASLAGAQLEAALEPQPWDPSVKSLVAFPQILAMMDKNLQWTEQLGDAFLGQQTDVMDSVQRLRYQAQVAGNLSSTPQQVVSGAPGAIIIEPAVPETIYVPTYNPQVVYGTWPWVEYPPYYFPPPPGIIYTNVGYISYYRPIVVVDFFWGWNRWDWHRHRIDIDDSRFERLNRGRPPIFTGNTWEHNPFHRHGVPYANPVVRQRFQTVSEEARRSHRGFGDNRSNGTRLNGALSSSSPAQAEIQHQASPSSNAQGNIGRDHNGTTQLRGSRVNRQPQIQAQPQVQPEPEKQPQQDRSRDRTSNDHRNFHQRQESNIQQVQPQAQPQQQHAAPVFESFSRGSDVRMQSQRGFHSRSTAPAAAPVAPTPPAAPQKPAQPVVQQQKQQQDAPADAGQSGGGHQRGKGDHQRGGSNPQRDSGDQHDDRGNNDREHR